MKCIYCTNRLDLQLPDESERGKEKESWVAVCFRLHHVFASKVVAWDTEVTGQKGYTTRWGSALRVSRKQGAAAARSMDAEQHLCTKSESHKLLQLVDSACAVLAKTRGPSKSSEAARRSGRLAWGLITQRFIFPSNCTHKTQVPRWNLSEFQRGRSGMLGPWLQDRGHSLGLHSHQGPLSQERGQVK